MSRIMIVDDDATSAKFLARLVAGSGHEVESFQLGSEAIARGRECPPDLLITDWLLKDQLDGEGVVRAIREVAPNLPVVVISGLPRHHLLPSIRALGHATLVEKPIMFDALQAQIDHGLAREAHSG